MNAFIVELPNRRGELAHLAGVIAQRGINITGCCGATSGERGSVVLLTNDEPGTGRALDEAGYAYRQVELVSVWVSDRPGGLAEAARRVDDAGVNIDALIPIQTVGANIRVSFATDNPARARAALGDEVLVARDAATAARKRPRRAAVKASMIDGRVGGNPKRTVQSQRL